MRIDTEYYTHCGGQPENRDCLRCPTPPLTGAVLCDGVNGAPGGGEASAFCAESLISRLTEGQSPAAALTWMLEAFPQWQRSAVLYRRACSTACLCTLTDGVCSWASIGDTRLYRFSGGRMADVTPDDSAAFTAYRAGKTAYAQLRLHPQRSMLTACLGDPAARACHSGQWTLEDGDALLLCSDGFWQYVFETEMELDLCKAGTAADWLRAMLLRLTRRSMLDGDNLTAWACFYRGGTDL